LEKHLIVGIDPGTTVGLAFLDVDGNVLKIKSSRGLSIDEIITEIASVGKAAILASDKAVVPPIVNKLSGILGARLFTPDSDLLVERKRELAQKADTKNDHERDALAAAVYAYYNFQNKIRRIEKQVADQLEGIKARVLKGEKVSDMFAPSQEGDGEGQLRAQMGALRKEIRELRAENEYLARSQPRSPNAILRRAAREAKDLMLKVAKGRLILLRDVPSLNYLDLKNIFIKRGDYILCRNKGNDGKGLRFLESRKVEAIISPVQLESLVPTCDLKSIEIISWEGLYFGSPVDIQEACGRRREVEARDLRDMLVEYKKGRR
jgi:predicted RNase H-like nuclease (RuvC/YqgF family)